MITDNQDSRNDSLGYFLTHKMWLKSLDLIELQVSQINQNRHYNKLSTFSYRNKSTDSRNALRDEKYFKSRIGNNLFYGLEKEFRCIPYLLPKFGGSRRNTKYLSYPLLAVHNAIGVYLLELTYAFRKQCAEKSSWYGADLDRFYEVKKAGKRKGALFYMPYYKRYQTAIHAQQRLQGYEHRAAIYFDIKDFFDELPVSILLELMEAYLGNDVKASFKFDQKTKYEIENFYRYVQDGKGVPQHELNTFSSFIANLYLQFANMAIRDSVVSYGNQISQQKIIQYVDDTWFFIDFAPWVSVQERDRIIIEAFERIVDELLNVYQLRLSPKTQIFYFDDEKDRKEMATRIIMTSLEYGSVDEFGEDLSAPSELFENVCKAVVELKSVRSSRAAISFMENTTENLSHIYKKGVGELLKKPSSLEMLEQAFEGFDFGLVKCAPLPLTILLHKVEKVWSRFRTYLLEKSHYSSHDIIIAIQYLAQIEFGDVEVLEKIRENQFGSILIDDFLLTEIPTEQPGYFNFSNSLVSLIQNEHDIIRQIERRVLAEKRKDFSVALNHLINELEATCFAFDPNRPTFIKNYNQEGVKIFLQTCGVSAKDLGLLPAIYSGRHSNSVSHPGSLHEPVQAVSKQIFTDYKIAVGRFVGCVLQRNPPQTESVSNMAAVN